MNLRTYVAKLQEMVDEGHGDLPVCVCDEYNILTSHREVGEDDLPSVQNYPYVDTGGLYTTGVPYIALN